MDMDFSIFYSWQSDLTSKYNRSFIEDCLKKAIKDLSKEIELNIVIYRDTKGLRGTPDIISSIFEKIDKRIQRDLFKKQRFNVFRRINNPGGTRARGIQISYQPGSLLVVEAAETMQRVFGNYEVSYTCNPRVAGFYIVK